MTLTFQRTLAPSTVLIFVLTCAAQPADDYQQTRDRITASVFTGPSMTTLRELSDGFGGRLSGSPAYQRAAEWAAAKFRSYGISNVKLEPFNIPNGWQRDWARGEIIAPMQRSLHIESFGWSPSTPSGGVQADVVHISDLSPDAIKAAARQIKGHIVLLDTTKIYAEGYRKAAGLLRVAYPLFRDEGALAVLSPDREMDNVLNAHSAGWKAELSPLPLVQVGMEDAKLIARTLQSANGSVRLNIAVQNKTSGVTPVNNVIAEIRGSDRPDEWIILGAHLDSWDFGTGAQDNGTGSAMVLEAARVLASLGHPPLRSIRFALWGGEEEGVLGSYAYTQAHAAELAKCIAVLNTDNGAGHPKGWKVEGRKDLMSAMVPISSSLKGLGGDDLSMEVTYDTDHGPFMLRGIPALDLEVDMSHYMEIHHKSSDTFDKVDPIFFKSDAAILTTTAYTIAQNPQPLAAHIDHAAVAEILKKADLDELLRDVGLWKP
jgi:carboxypeptidase Q